MERGLDKEQTGRELEEIALQLSWLHRGQRSLDERLEKIERSLLFRIVRWPGARYARIRNLVDRWLRRSDSQYREWLSYERLSLLPDRQECLRRIAAFAHRPPITIAMAASAASPGWLKKALNSVTTQIYSQWELCICADDDVDSATLALIEELTAVGASVRIVRQASAAGISAALNAACALANGEYIGFLKQDDVLSPYALFYLAEALQKLAPAILYSDEDRLTADGRRTDPLFKPAWSPELLGSTMYLSHFWVVSRTAFNAVGGFRNASDGSQDFDLCLRITARDERVVHIPRILYHRRECQEQPIIPAGQTLRAKRTTDRMVSIVICSRSPRLLKNVLGTIRSTTAYAAYEIIVAEHCLEGENKEMASLASAYGCKRVPVHGPFNFSRINNAAAERASGEFLLFLNDDIEPLRADWLSNMSIHLELEGIGIVGAKLVYPSGGVQHAGVVVGMGDGAGHVNRHKYAGVYWKWMDETRNVSAVTGACLAVRAELFQRLGGFDTAFPNNYNDVDFCLRVRAAGYRVVYEPAALLRHYEGQTRDLFVEYDERERFYMRWHRAIEGGDPYYNPNLTLEGEEAFLSFGTAEGDLAAREG